MFVRERNGKMIIFEKYSYVGNALDLRPIFLPVNQMSQMNLYAHLEAKLTEEIVPLDP